MELQAIKKDWLFMGKAIKQAKIAWGKGEVPVGAVIVSGDRVIARGYNSSITTNDPTAHAEIIALRRAAKKLKNYRLTGLTLYVTIEPCPMCLGAIIQSRIKRLVFGALDPKAGAVFSKLQFNFNQSNHHLEIVSGVREDECRQLLTKFFKEIRMKKNKSTGG
ncbi:MAG: tRNA adenosine(34) deaminase TadA [Candidatus Aminicenantes bacterium]|jgi:tRNA(adenine34) deaminase|nr:tRNA adenosine(34) deaminase TadA [Candidatus Aminicenantes bacterium]